MVTLSLDIETSGLTAASEAICYSLKPFGKPVLSRCRYLDELEDGAETTLLKILKPDIESFKVKPTETITIVTYNGENFFGGFDLPFLRTRFAMNFKQDAGDYWIHGNQFDLYPAIQKKLNTKVVKAEDPEDELDSPKKRKTKNTKKEKVADNNKLDYVYEMLGGKPLGYEHINGSLVPQMWQQFLDTRDTQILRDISAYNATDVIQLEYVYSIVYPMLTRKSRMWEEL